jgi:2-desacetyl-2-hydroxyethyl bacteriochlorophyllide A dehydrogenase
MKTKKLFFEKKKTVRIHEDTLSPPGPEEVLVQTQFSAISAGTELLFYRNNFPVGMPKDITLKSLSGEMEYPIQYGYAVVGKVITVGEVADTKLLNKSVFLFHPHQSHIVVPQTEVYQIPLDLDKRKALFLPNMETAVGCVMDARPIIGEDVVIFGQGIVGLLTTAILANFPLGNLIAIDPLNKRREMSKILGATKTLDPYSKSFSGDLESILELNRAGPEQVSGADLIFELSGNPEVLNTAISIAGYNSRIIAGSWYGQKKALLDLGDRFHRNRLQIISSQVSTIHPNLRGRWSKERRLELVWGWLKEINPSRLISHQIPISEAQSAYELLDEKPEEVLQVVLHYEGSG